jgi:hypothetical protein
LIYYISQEALLKNIPATQNSLVVRTDFSNEPAWQSICLDIQQPVGEFQAYVDFLSDLEYDGLTVKQLASLVLQDSDHSFIFIVDQIALSHPERPILVVDLDDEPMRTFRVIPAQMWSVENNLSIANMDFSDFADAVDQDGIFRKFSGG